MGALLDKPKTEYIDEEEGDSNGQSWGVSSMQGWRTEMEDQHVVHVDFLPGHSLYAVFDGHGGRNAALFAAAGLVNAIVGTAGWTCYVADQTDIAALREALSQGFLAVDDSMRAAFNPRMHPNERSGCTAIATIVTPTHIVTANAGDSRALLCRAGANVPLSFDHKPWLPEEKRRIEAANGTVSMKRVDGELAVSRALGDFDFKDPDTFATRPEACKVTGLPDVSIVSRVPEADMFLVLACDGIWDVMSNEEVIGAVTRYAAELGEGSPLRMAEELMEDCLALSSKDNMSVCVCLFPAGKELVRPGLPGTAPLRAARAANEAAAKLSGDGGSSNSNGASAAFQGGPPAGKM